MYASGTMPEIQRLIRVDICAEQLSRHATELPILGDAASAIDALNAAIDGDVAANGADRAAKARRDAFDEIGPEMRALCDTLAEVRGAVPGAIMVGDSAQPIYAGNLYYDHDRPGGWFNAATGFGALGYGIPAAIGAALAAPDTPVICIAGDGGAQFSLPELMCAVQEKLPICFLIWNNHGYQEIATSMVDAGVSVVGCDPTPPDFAAVAQSCGLPFWRCDTRPGGVAEALQAAMVAGGPSLIEIQAQPSPVPAKERA